MEFLQLHLEQIVLKRSLGLSPNLLATSQIRTLPKNCNFLLIKWIVSGTQSAYIPTWGTKKWVDEVKMDLKLPFTREW